MPSRYSCVCSRETVYTRVTHQKQKGRKRNRSFWCCLLVLRFLRQIAGIWLAYPELFRIWLFWAVVVGLHNHVFRFPNWKKITMLWREINFIFKCAAKRPYQVHERLHFFMFGWISSTILPEESAQKDASFRSRDMIVCGLLIRSIIKTAESRDEKYTSFPAAFFKQNFDGIHP